MKVHGDYDQAGYAHLESLMPAEVTKALLDHFWGDVRDGNLPYVFRRNALLSKPAMELHGSHSPAITTFLWGLTPIMSVLTQCDLLPSYAYFRLYQKGDKLQVHVDRSACEHSLSLTLGYSDGEVWSFEIGQEEAGDAGKSGDFGEAPYSSIGMLAGDAVLYRGIQRRHGRLTPNPNKWSAHLFLHWVERGGPYSELAFEGLRAGARRQPPPET